MGGNTMSNWVDFRDGIIDSLQFDTVTDTMKQQLTNWLIETCLPLAETAAASFIAQTKEQAAEETGWCKIRDLIVLPAIINGGLWLVTKGLNATKTA